MYTHVIPTELNVSRIMRIASELPFTEGCPAQLDMLAGSSSRNKASSKSSGACLVSGQFSSCLFPFAVRNLSSSSVLNECDFSSSDSPTDDPGFVCLLSSMSRPLVGATDDEVRSMAGTGSLELGSVRAFRSRSC